MSKSHSHLEILHPLSALLERHTSRIIDQDHHVKQADLHQIRGKLDREAPLRSELGERARLHDPLGDGLEGGWWVEGLEALLWVEAKRVLSPVWGT